MSVQYDQDDLVRLAIDASKKIADLERENKALRNAIVKLSEKANQKIKHETYDEVAAQWAKRWDDAKSAG